MCTSCLLENLPNPCQIRQDNTFTSVGKCASRTMVGRYRGLQGPIGPRAPGMGPATRGGGEDPRGEVGPLGPRALEAAGKRPTYGPWGLGGPRGHVSPDGGTCPQSQ